MSPNMLLHSVIVDDVVSKIERKIRHGIWEEGPPLPEPVIVCINVDQETEYVRVHFVKPMPASKLRHPEQVTLMRCIVDEVIHKTSDVDVHLCATNVRDFHRYMSDMIVGFLYYPHEDDSRYFESKNKNVKATFRVRQRYGWWGKRVHLESWDVDVPKPDKDNNKKVMVIPFYKNKYMIQGRFLPRHDHKVTLDVDVPPGGLKGTFKVLTAYVNGKHNRNTVNFARTCFIDPETHRPLLHNIKIRECVAWMNGISMQK